MTGLTKHYFHRVEVEVIERLVEYCVEADNPAAARVTILMGPEAFPSDRKGSGTVGRIVERRCGAMKPGPIEAPPSVTRGKQKARGAT